MTEKEAFLALVRLGVEMEAVSSDRLQVSSSFDWGQLKALAEEQGLSAVVLDGIERLPEGQRPPQVLLLEWIGAVLQEESVFAEQHKAAVEMAKLYACNYIRTYVLKGEVVAECYPKSNHRVSSDMDCYLLPNGGNFDAWNLGNELIKAQGHEVKTSFYKNSTFFLPGLVVENHQYMVPFRGNKRLESLELMLQSYMHADKKMDKMEGTELYRPPIMVTSLFLIEHAYSHFLHEGLTWRMVLDWMMFSRKHQQEIEWYALDALIDEFGFRRFYDSYNRIGKYMLGEIQASSFTVQEKKMLADVWKPLDLHDNHYGLKGKLALAGNTWRARWKYHYFSEISWIHALWIQAKGVLFIKKPKL